MNLVRTATFLACCSFLSACLSDDDDEGGPPAELRERVERIETLSTVEPWAVSQERIGDLRREVGRMPREQRHRLVLIEARNLVLAGDPSRALTILRELLDKDLSPRYAIRARVLASNAAALVEEHETAFQHLIHGLGMLETVQDPGARADVLGRASYLFGLVGEHERSRSYGARAVQEARETEDNRELCAELVQYANSQYMTPQWPAEDILESLRQAQVPCTRAGDPIYTATIDSIRGQIELNAGNVQSAIAHLEDAYAEMQVTGYAQGIEDVGLWLAKARHRDGGVEEARRLLDWLPEALEERGRWQAASDAWHVKSRFHETLGDLEQAYRYQERSRAARSEALNDEQAMRTAYLQVDFRSRLNEIDAKLLEERSRGDRLVRNSSIAGCVMLVWVVFLVYRRYRLSGRLNEVIEDKNTELIALGSLVRRINARSSPLAILETFMSGVTDVLDGCRYVEILKRDASRSVYRSFLFNASGRGVGSQSSISVDEVNARYLNGARIGGAQGLSRQAYLQDRSDPNLGEHAVLLVFPFGDAEWIEAVMLIEFDMAIDEVDSRFMGRVSRLASHADTVIHRVRELDDVLDEKKRADAAISALRQTYVALRSAVEVVGESSRRKDHFLSSASHYLRTPLQSILGHASRLDRELGSRVTPYKRHIGNIRASSEHLSALVSGLTDSGDVLSGNDELVEEKSLLYPVIDQVCEMLRPQADARHNQLDIHVDDHLFVQTDLLKLRQIVINLVSNAIRFTRNGVVAIHAGRMTAPDGRQRQWLSLMVRDNGVGVSPEDQECIFQPFRQSGAKTDGTGLGLAVTKSLCHRLGGDISVDSVPGQGASFNVSLPILINDADHDRDAGVRSAPAPGSVPVSGTVLVVEDDPVNRALVEEYLRMEGFAVEAVGTGRDALSSFQRLAPDLILMDMSLPDTQGDDVTLRIRESELGNIRVPIIALSAFCDQKTRNRAMDAGCSIYLTKPVDFEALVERVRDLINNRR